MPGKAAAFSPWQRKQTRGRKQCWQRPTITILIQVSGRAMRRHLMKGLRVPMAEERLQKLMANAGIASRRKAEELILAGRVSVNGKTVTELGSKADLSTDRVKVDGQVLTKPESHIYIAFHKPKNVVTTVRDPEGRETVMSYFKGMRERIYPV